MQSVKRFSDEYYKAVALECEARLFSSIPENDGITEPHVFSERFERRMDEIIRSFDKPKRKISKKWKVIIAVIAAVIAMLLTALSVGAFRESLYRLFFIEKNPSYAVFSYQLVDDEKYTVPDKIETIYSPQYVPEGYIQTEELIFDFTHTITYTKGVVFFEFKQSTMDSVYTTNMEDVEADSVRINGRDVFIVTGRGHTSAFWCNDEYRFNISGEISREDAEKVIASVAKS